MRWLCAFVFSISAVGAAGFDSLLYRPAMGDSKLLSVWSSKPLEQYAVWVGTTLTFEANSFQIVRNGAPSQIVLGKSMIQHFGLGLTMIERWMELSVDVPVGLSVEFTNPNVSGASRENQIVSADTRLYWRANLMPRKKIYSLSLMPFMQFPTGSNEQFMGTESLSGGFLFIADGEYSKKFSASLNLGVYTQKKFAFRDIVIEDQLLWGLGMQYLFVPEMAISGEFFGRSKLQSPFNNKRDNPAEFLANFRFYPPVQGLKIDFGGGVGIVRGTGAPEYRLLMGLQYRT